MPAWIPCQGKFLEGDVIRWTEAIWREAKGRRRPKRPEKRGERLVTAEVLKTDSAGFISLSVLGDEITANKYGMPLKALKTGETLRRKPVTLTKGGATRRPWAGKDGESARALAVSRFMR